MLCSTRVGSIENRVAIDTEDSDGGPRPAAVPGDHGPGPRDHVPQAHVSATHVGEVGVRHVTVPQWAPFGGSTTPTTPSAVNRTAGRTSTERVRVPRGGTSDT